MSQFLREAARLQPALVKSLHTLHRRAEAAIQEAAIADTLLDAREVAPAPGRPAAASTSAAAALTAAGASPSPLRSLQAPDAYTAKPLLELELLALRSAQMLRRRLAAERRLSVVVAVVVGVFVGIALYLLLATPNLASGLVLLGAAALALALAVLKWQPYRRAARTHHLARLADDMAAHLRGKLQALDALADHPTRHLQQWTMVIELTDPLRDLWGG